MPVIRVSKTKGFTVMSNYHLQDKNLSLKAKGLLSMMLSLPDGWHYNVRGLASICKEGVSSISSTFRDLIDAGYVHRHQPIIDGKFGEIEYVIYETPQAKKLDNPDSDDTTTPDGSDDEADFSPSPDNKDCSAPCSVKAHPTSSHTASACAETPCSGNPHTENPDTDTWNAYKILSQENTQTEITYPSNYPSINHTSKRPDAKDGMGSAQEELLARLGAQRLTGKFEEYREIVQGNIEFDSLCQTHETDRETLEGIVELIVEVLCSQQPYTRISGQDFPTDVVRSRFLKLDSRHIEYVLLCLASNTTKVRNMKSYLLATLYNAPVTMEQYYQNWVISDMPYLAKNS